MADQIAWLIEAPGTKYLAVQSLRLAHKFEWTADHGRALRFCSFEQAGAVLMTLRQMDREMDSMKNGGRLSWGSLFAFEPELGNAKAVEHMWTDATLKEDKPRA